MRDPDLIVTSKYRTTGGRRFRCSVRTEAGIDMTAERLRVEHPDAELQIIQGCYNDGPLSAGTHNLDKVLDFRVVGLDWWKAQDFLRACGWAVWFRHTGTWAVQSRWHLHAILLGGNTKVGKYVDGGLSTTGRKYTSSQIDDYYAHSLGLAGQHASGADHSWFPSNIAATIFEFDRWENPVTALTDTCNRLGITYTKGGRLLFRAALVSTKNVTRINKIRTALGAAPKE